MTLHRRLRILSGGGRWRLKQRWRRCWPVMRFLRAKCLLVYLVLTQFIMHSELAEVLPGMGKIYVNVFQSNVQLLTVSTVSTATSKTLHGQNICYIFVLFSQRSWHPTEGLWRCEKGFASRGRSSAGGKNNTACKCAELRTQYQETIELQSK